MAHSFLPSSLYYEPDLYDGKEENAATAESVAAAVLSLSEYKDGDLICGRKPGSKTVSPGICFWYDNYLRSDPIYPLYRFREVFRIARELYHIIEDELLEEEPLIKQRRDC